MKILNYVSSKSCFLTLLALSIIGLGILSKEWNMMQHQWRKATEDEQTIFPYGGFSANPPYEIDTIYGNGWLYLGEKVIYPLYAVGIAMQYVGFIILIVASSQFLIKRNVLNTGDHC